MNIQKIDNQTFGALDTAKANNALFRRLNSGNRYVQYEMLERWQRSKPYNIVLEGGKNNNLTATVVDGEGATLLKRKESLLKGMLNLSPIKFLRNICKNAEKLVTEKHV